LPPTKKNQLTLRRYDSPQPEVDQSFETLVVQRQVSELIRHHLTNVAGLSAFTSMVSAMLNNVCESL
jgi:hypothetical protein